jgi:Ca-activated chloride channel family protein
MKAKGFGCLKLPAFLGLRHVGIFAYIFYLGVGSYTIIGSAAQAAGAQMAPYGLSSEIIRISTNLVTVPVSVTDSDGNIINNLGSQDFLIEEDGQPETISRIAEAGQSPLQLALLFDLSGSVNSRFQFEQQAAIRFLEKVWKPGDTVSLIVFSECPQIRLRTSSSLSEALKVLLDLEPTEGPTAFFDSVVLSANLLRQSAGLETRQSEIVLSDGEDNKSNYSFSEALREIQHSDTVFYSINPSGPSLRLNEISRKGQSDLASLAKETGGNAFVSDNTNDLDEIFNRIAVELRAQYLLSYYSTNSQPDGKFRQISVSIPNRPSLRIRTRRGYYATIHKAAATDSATESPAPVFQMLESTGSKLPSLLH